MFPLFLFQKKKKKQEKRAKEQYQTAPRCLTLIYAFQVIYGVCWLFRFVIHSQEGALLSKRVVVMPGGTKIIEFLFDFLNGFLF